MGWISSVNANALQTQSQIVAHLDQKQISQIKIEARAGKPGAYRYGVVAEFKPLTVPDNVKEWQKEGDVYIWRAKATSSGALSIELGLKRLFLPEGVVMRLLDSQGKLFQKEINNKMNSVHSLRLPFVAGDTAYIELKTKDVSKISHVQVTFDSLTHAVLPLWGEEFEKSGSCNVDVACPEGVGWENQIKSVARYSFTQNGSTFLCTGQMINNTAEDHKPYFLTANHCISNEADANTIVAYFNYESETCRTPGGMDSGTPIQVTGFNDTLSGTSLVATNALSDFALLVFDHNPPQNYNVYWTGWDRRDQTFNSGTSIHHPAGNAKRISHENDPVSIDDYGPAPSGDTTTHIKITDWDVGTTEGGSSGAGLWNPNGLLIGQLHGGFAACGNNSSDWYGRFFTSWSTGSTPQTRLADWLDPAQQGVKTLQGLSDCDGASFSIQSSVNQAVPGQKFTYSSQVSGQGPFSYEWDVDGDGHIDSTESTVEVSYPSAYSGAVSLSVTDGSSCKTTVTQASIVKAPEFVVSTGDREQICGDGDYIVEPGERWRIPVSIENSNQPATEIAAVFTKSNGVLSFSKSTGGSAVYSYADSQEASCQSNFIDISSTGESLNFAPASSFPALDDGSASIDLDGIAIAGEPVSHMQVSSNGYIAVNGAEADDGNDVSNDCPIGPPSSGDSSAPRLVPLHGDLVIGGAFYQRFDSCPRASDIPGQNESCHIVQWVGAGIYQDGSSPVGDFSFEVIMYENSGEIVYAYGPGITGNGAETSTGILPGDLNQTITYACDTPDSIADNSAVCFFVPGNEPPVNSEGVYLDKAVVTSAGLSPGQSASGSIELRLDPDVQCGTGFGINLDGVVYSGGYQAKNSSAYSDHAGGIDGVCDNTVSCPAPTGASVTPGTGLWNNAPRTGSGVDLYSVAGQNFAAWYTARPDGTPIWYWLQAPYVGNQWQTNIGEITWDHATLTATYKVVGQGALTFDSSTKAWFTWKFDDGHAGGEPIEQFIQGSENPQPDYSNMWFNPGESGWGVTFNSKDPINFAIPYIYDAQGDPTWVLGTTTDDDGGAIGTVYVTGACPWCAWVNPSSVDSGGINLNFGANSTIDSSIDLPQPRAGDWLRIQLPIETID
ncbi:MAG: hypothetical protein ACWA5R_08505 [bacterium]